MRSIPAGPWSPMPPWALSEDGSHMKAAMQDSELLGGRGASAFRGSRKEDSGGGGIDRIISGGGPSSEQSPWQMLILLR